MQPIASYHGSSPKPTHPIPSHLASQLITISKNDRHREENAAANVGVPLSNEKSKLLPSHQTSTNLQTKSIQEHPVNSLTLEALQLSISFQNILEYLKRFNNQPQEDRYLELANQELVRFDIPITNTFYRNIEYVGEGMLNRVFKAILIQGRATLQSRKVAQLL
ncbi:hypothetical protein Aasi_0936 [Candidatus Amoebophilus asiaticus 5a2]|uniref:Uncharacterized protein n=1 Tax=Amoebophilus asiaticus (strain 5a2) TaxID=452471 RepID=B3ESU6_AMOA5|nr:hypothetical protein [Candidatus Amoebophilus asiaticus]ACE06298.1 hypothetical protein Aasi_0936 [Candidatus Amoebophilus asiaticus 5a2]